MTTPPSQKSDPDARAFCIREYFAVFPAGFPVTTGESHAHERHDTSIALAALLPSARRTAATPCAAAPNRRLCAGDGRADRRRPQPDGRRTPLRPQAGAIHLPPQPRRQDCRNYRDLADGSARQVAPHRPALSTPVRAGRLYQRRCDPRGHTYVRRTDGRVAGPAVPEASPGQMAAEANGFRCATNVTEQ